MSTVKSKDVLAQVVATPGQTKHELMPLLGIGHANLGYHLTKLTASGEVHHINARWYPGNGENVLTHEPWRAPPESETDGPKAKRKKRVDEIQDAGASEEPALIMPCVWADGSMTLTRGEESFYLPADDVISLCRFMTLSLPHFRLPSPGSGISPEEQKQLQKLLPNLTDFLHQQGANL